MDDTDVLNFSASATPDQQASEEKSDSRAHPRQSMVALSPDGASSKLARQGRVTIPLFASFFPLTKGRRHRDINPLARQGKAYIGTTDGGIDKMQDVKERIEGSFRLIAFRRMKRRIFLLEVIMILSIAVGLMAIMGASLNPFYMPMDYFLLMAFVLILMLVPEAQYLSLLEIAQTKSKSGKYLMARNNIRNATAIIVLCVVFVIMFALPPSVKAMEEGYTTTTLLNVGPDDNATWEFTTRDTMGTRSVEQISFEPSYGDIYVYVMKYEDWNAGNFNTQRRDNQVNFTEEGVPLTFSPGEHATGFQRYIVSINSTSSSNVAVDVTVTYSISKVITGYMPIMGIIFIVLEGLTVSYFLPIREKYASSSIFSKNYVETQDAGAEKLSEREAALDRTLSEDEILKEAELSEPVCPQELPAASQAKPSQARKKGVVDVGAPSASDVACQSCGAMNSPDSALCFSCGCTLDAMAEIVVSPEELMSKGAAFLEQGRNKDAVWCFDEVLKMEHKNVPALFLKAKALLGDGRRELAIQYLNTVIQLNPENQDAHLMRGEIFVALEMHEKAADSFEKALAMGPSDLAMAKLKELRARDREEVINQFMTLPGIGPAKANALFEAGLTSVEALKGASLEKLCSVKGINERVAKKILRDMGREV
jgi:tetratricopeptide (TPR) repeat protein